MAGRIVELTNRHPGDQFPWLDNGIPHEGHSVTIKPAAKRGRRKGVRALEHEKRWDEYLDWLASGQSRQDYAVAVGTSLSSLYRWERKTDERMAQVNMALEQSADTVADQAGWVARTCPPDREYVARAKLLISHLQWKAERLSSRYGQRAEVTDSPEVVLIVRREQLPTAAERKAQIIEMESGRLADDQGPDDRTERDITADEV